MLFCEKAGGRSGRIPDGELAAERTGEVLEAGGSCFFFASSSSSFLLATKEARTGLGRGLLDFREKLF